MSWFSQFFRREQSEPGVASVRSVTFDTAGLRVEARKPKRLEWRDLEEDQVVASIDDATTDGWPAIVDLDALRAYYRQQAAADGGIVAVDVVLVDGIPAARIITKREDLPAYIYEGELLIPLRNARFCLSLSAREHGTTGTREAVMTSYLLGRGLLSVPEGPPSSGGRRVEGWFRDPYDPAFDDSALCALSDDERLDPLFPDHPLTKLRRWLSTVVDTVSVSHDVRPDSIEGLDEAVSAGRPDELSHLSSSAVGMLYFTVGKLDLAEKYLAESIPVSDGEPTVSDVETAANLNVLGLARESQGKFPEAGWALSRALTMFRATAGDQHLDTARAAGSLARVYVSLRRFDDAEPLLDEVLPLFQEHESDVDLAVALNDKGLVGQARGQHADAIPLFRRALEHFETAVKAQGRPIRDRATVLANLAAALEAVGDRSGAKAARGRIRDVVRESEEAEARGG